MLVLVPLAHSGSLVDPFFLPKEIVLLAGALVIGALAIVSYLLDDDAAGPRSVALWIAAAYVAVSGLAAAWAVNRGLAAWALAEIAAGAAIGWGTARFVRSEGAAALLCLAVLASAALVALVSLAQVFVPGISLAPGGVSLIPASRGGGTLGDAGLAAQYLILALPAGIGAAALSAGRLRLVCGGLLGLVGAAIVFAGRPEGWIAAVAVVALVIAARVAQVALGSRRWAVLAPNPAGESVWSLLIGLILLAAVVSLSRWPGLWQAGSAAAPLHGVTLLSPTTGDPAADRAAAARGTLALVSRHPLGVGPGNWRHAFLEVAWTAVEKSPFTLSHQAVHAGNAFLEAAAESGVIGGLLLALLVAVLLVQAGVAAARAPAPWDRAGLAALATIAACALVGSLASSFQAPAQALVFWVMAGLAHAALARTPASSGPLAILAASERPLPPPPLRRRAAAYACAGVWCVAAAGLGWWAADRVAASRLTKDGHDAFSAGNYQEAAIRLGRPAARRSPDYLPHALAASAFQRLGFHELAEQRFGDALARSPHFVAAYLGRAASYEARGRYDLAEQDLHAAQRIWPGNAEIRMALGRLNATRGRPDDALADFKAALQLDGSLAEAYARMGDLYLRRGQLDEAIEAYRLCLMKNPRYPRAQISLGNAFFRKGLTESALRYYQAAGGADPKDVEARLRIANAHHALGQPCEALDALQAARELQADAAQRETILDLIEQMEAACRKERRQGARP
jgi:tetratricopeptide (TPR) repeat protein